MITERFTVTTNWHKDAFENSKSHLTGIDGKASLEISAAVKFKGDATAYNPEDLLLSALSSCHFMSYQYVCKQAGIELLSYRSKTTGIIEVEETGAGAFTSITIFPEVVISDSSDRELALELHHKAHQLCFIANSLSCTVAIEAAITFK